MGYFTTLIRLQNISSSNSLSTICKAKKYLKPGQKPPADVKVTRGKRGGIYYMTEDVHAARGTTPQKRLPAFRKQEDNSLRHRTKTGEHGPGSYFIREKEGQHHLSFVSPEGQEMQLGSHADIRELKKQVDKFKSGNEKIEIKTFPKTSIKLIKPEKGTLKPRNHPVIGLTREEWKLLPNSMKIRNGDEFGNKYVMIGEGKYFRVKDRSRFILGRPEHQFKVSLIQHLSDEWDKWDEKENQMHEYVPLKINAIKQIRLISDLIIGQDYETLMAISSLNETVRFKKDGERNQVRIEPDEFKEFKGKRVLHNHPSGDNSFSVPDIVTAHRMEASEMWVVGNKGTLFLLLPPEGREIFITSDLGSDFNKIVQTEDWNVRDELQPIVNKHPDQETCKWAGTEHTKRFMKRLAGRGLFRYYEIPSGDV